MNSLQDNLLLEKWEGITICQKNAMIKICQFIFNFKNCRDILRFAYTCIIDFVAIYTYLKSEDLDLHFFLNSDLYSVQCPLQNK